MSCTDPIADMLTVIRNGSGAGKKVVTFPHSAVKEGVCRVLMDEGYLTSIDLLDTQPARQLRVGLKYDVDGESVIHELRRVSTPGRRIYRRRSQLKPIIRGFGISVLSTSHGVLSDKSCRAANLGGEVICVVR